MCIDQSNHKEKAHQIGVIRSIYINSEQTICFIDEEAHESRRILELAKQVTRKVKERAPFVSNNGTTLYVSGMIMDMIKEIGSSFEALAQLGSDDWDYQHLLESEENPGIRQTHNDAYDRICDRRIHRNGD